MGAFNLDFSEVPAGSELDAFHFEMWVGCMQMLIGLAEVRTHFETETKTPPFRAARTGLEALIDTACGNDAEAYVASFCRWATPAYWGDDTDICPAIATKLAA